MLLQKALELKNYRYMLYEMNVLSINDIEKIQEFFCSDIRSMINYIQLNFDIKELSINVINKEILQKIDDYFLIFISSELKK